MSRCSAANNVSLDNISAVDISKIILWNNCYILIGGKTVFNKRLVDKGIVRIGDLIAENNEIITSMDESVKHLFVSCLITQSFWAEVIKWCSNRGVVINHLSAKDILFGIKVHKDNLIY